MKNIKTFESFSSHASAASRMGSTRDNDRVDEIPVIINGAEELIDAIVKIDRKGYINAYMESSDEYGTVINDIEVLSTPEFTLTGIVISQAGGHSISLMGTEMDEYLADNPGVEEQLIRGVEEEYNNYASDPSEAIELDRLFDVHYFERTGGRYRSTDPYYGT